MYNVFLIDLKMLWVNVRSLADWCVLLYAAITEMLPSILSQVVRDSVDNLRWLASTLSKTGDDGKLPTSAAAAPIAEEDEEVPGLSSV